MIDGEKGVRDVEALGRFRVVLQQDIDNFHLIQKGMMTSAKGVEVQRTDTQPGPMIV